MFVHLDNSLRIYLVFYVFLIAKYQIVITIDK